MTGTEAKRAAMERRLEAAGVVVSTVGAAVHLRSGQRHVIVSGLEYIDAFDLAALGLERRPVRYRWQDTPRA